MARTADQILAEITGNVTGSLIIAQAIAQAQLESLREQLAIVTAERDALKATAEPPA